MDCKKAVFLIMLVAGTVLAYGQNYHALNGSSYAGGIGVHNNPASIVSTPYKWDITILGVQAKTSTNVLSIQNYSLLSSPANSEYMFERGEKSRYALAAANVNLLNTRIALNRTNVIAFGVNVRNYTRLKTSQFYYIDTLKSVSSFLSRNTNNQLLGGDVYNSGWIEVYGSYGTTVLDNGIARVNAGISLKLSRGVTGAYASVQNLRFSRTPQGNPPAFTAEAGNAIYGYSSNFDYWSSSNAGSQNIRNLITRTQGGASIDAGVELLIRPQSVPGVFEDDSYYDYDWKIGLSLLDLGANQYTYGLQSRVTGSINQGITSADINTKFDSTIQSVRAFNDSLATIMSSTQAIVGKFRVLNPTRLVLNVDRFVYGAFFINAELSLNLSGIFGKKWLYVKEMNALVVTPRWELRKWGAYMPISYNVQNQLWVGAAVKLGPLLFGLHNLAYIFSKKSIHNGGGYITLTLRAPNDSGSGSSRQLNCPPPVW